MPDKRHFFIAETTEILPRLSTERGGGMVRRWKATTSRRAVYEDAMPSVGIDVRKYRHAMTLLVICDYLCPYHFLAARQEQAEGSRLLFHRDYGGSRTTEIPEGGILTVKRGHICSW
jgi:hypothetical protein